MTDFIGLQSQQKLIRAKIDHAISKVLDHGKFVFGPEVEELEETLAQYCGAKYCISVSDGTMGLLLALNAYDLQAGDEVITTPFSYFATLESILHSGATPVFVDINPVTFNIDEKLIEEKITNKTKAILAVSLFGQCANFKEINKIAKKHNLIVIEDAAQSFGATHHGVKSCNLSNVAVTSFFPTKPLGCYGDGGACFTNDDQIAEKLKLLRNHGTVARNEHCLIGHNSRLDTIQAAILLTKLKIFDNEIGLRNKISEQYDKFLPNNITRPKILPQNTSVYAQYTIKCLSRNTLVEILKTHNVAHSTHYHIPLYKQYCYQKNTNENFPKSQAVSEQCLSLPMHPYLDLSTIKKTFNSLYTHPPDTPSNL